MKKKQPKQCLQFYTQANFLEELKNNAREESKFRRKILQQTLLQKHLDTAKKDFTRRVHEEMNIQINQVKVAGHGASVENGRTTMEFLDPKNRIKVMKLFNCINEKKKKILTRC